LNFYFIITAKRSGDSGMTDFAGDVLLAGVFLAGVADFLPVELLGRGLSNSNETVPLEAWKIKQLLSKCQQIVTFFLNFD